jgi:hypothetical protein
VKELLRLLEIVRRELGAEDAYVQLGGRRPEDPTFVVHEGAPIADDSVDADAWRLVTRFAAPPEDPDELQSRLGELVGAFTRTIGDAARPEPTPDGDGSEVKAQRARRARLELDGTLRMLAERAGAQMALVVDARSPQLWGASLAELRDLDLDEAISAARALDEGAEHGLEAGVVAQLDESDPDGQLRAIDSLELRTRLALAGDLLRGLQERGCHEQLGLAVLRAVAGVRALEPIHRRTATDGDPPLIVHPFAGIYRLLLVFDGSINELKAEAVVHRALPVVERMVAGLPPIDPRPKGGRIFAFLRPV